jgi:hypothetical protein
MPSYDDDLDDYGAEDYDLYDEAVRPVRTVRTARPASVTARSTDRPVSQAQLQMVISQFNGRLVQNSGAIQRVNTAVNGVGRDLRRQAATIHDTRQDVSQLRDLTLILPLLQGAIGQENQQLALLLPFLLAGGIGGGSSGGYGRGGSGGLLGGDGLLLILLLTSVLKNDSTTTSAAISRGK